MSYSNIHYLLKDATRRKIVEFVGRKGRVTYTDILRELGISTGKLNYHLRILSSLLQRQENDEYYSLNDLGRNAFTLLEGFRQEPPANERSLIFRRISWLLISLSMVTMYFGIPDGIILDLVFDFISIVLLISAVFFMYYSQAFDFTFRQVIALSALGLAFGLPTGMYIFSNPFIFTSHFQWGFFMISVTFLCL
jgi:DNA-binding transcriptional ArsR family regulator